jgi:Putative peptidoglycan-binding domain-containing protein
MNYEVETEWFDTQSEQAVLDRFAAAAWNSEVNDRSREYIRWVQRSLNQVLGLRLAQDGILGAQTRQAVRTFQKQYGLTVDGIVGQQTERALTAAGAGQQLRPANVGTTAAPSRSTDLAIGTTLYTSIDLAIVNQGRRIAEPITGIFLPRGYRPQPRVDMILYLHGFKTRPDLTIEEYWDRQQFPHFALREDLNNSRRNVVLVAPTLGPRSQTGRLLQAGNLDNFVAQVLTALGSSSPFNMAKITPQLGSLILACHSGGGYPMRQLALGAGTSAAAIHECWGFDCTYNRGDDTLWAQWARRQPTARLFIYYIPDSRTEALASSLKNKQVPNIAVLPTRPRGGHNWVPITHWRERIERAPFLSVI